MNMAKMDGEHKLLRMIEVWVEMGQILKWMFVISKCSKPLWWKPIFSSLMYMMF
jgi:hypothetical protein